MPDPQVIEVSANDRQVHRVGSGETFENVIFDQTAPGSAATLIAEGSDWTIRNVAWRGEYSHRGRAIAVSDTGDGNSLVSNVYMGDGVDESVGNRRHPQFGLWVNPNHSGHITIERMYVYGAHDNAFYGSAPGTNSNGQRGTLTYRNLRAVDCWVSGFRIARGRVENCVHVNTGNGRNGRGIWVWPTDYHDDPVEIENVDLVNDGGYVHVYDFGRSGRTTEATVRNTRYEPASSTRFEGDVRLDESGIGHDPEDRWPEGCPDSVDAVFSDADIDLPEMYEHTITIEGTGEYFLEVEDSPLAISDTDDGDEGVMQTFPEGEDDPKRVSGVIDGGEHTVTYDEWLCDVGVSDRDDVSITINDNYDPTWSMYPTDASDGRDWLDDVPWWDEEDQPPEPPEEPEAPTGLEVSFVGETAAAISWDEMEHARAYDVSLDGNPAGRTEATAYDFGDLEAETTYVAEVYSVGEDDFVSEPSEVQFVTEEAPLDPPDAVTGVDVTDVTQVTARVSWDVSDRATQYRVLLEGERVAELPQTEHRLSDLEPGTEYEVAVSAWNEAGETEPVPMSFETNEPPEDPDPPEDLADRVDVLEAETEQQDAEIIGLQSRIDGLDSRVMDLEGQVADTEEDVEDVQSWRERLFGAFSR